MLNRTDDLRDVGVRSAVTIVKKLPVGGEGIPGLSQKFYFRMMINWLKYTWLQKELLTTYIISKWGVLGPEAGSGILIKSDCTLENPKLLATLFEMKPVLFTAHWLSASSNWTGSRRMWSKLSFPLTVKILGRRVWSIKFLPTIGLLTSTGIFNGARSALFPIPDSCRICTVPMDPAERITSFRAWACSIGVPDMMHWVYNLLIAQYKRKQATWRRTWIRKLNSAEGFEARSRRTRQEFHNHRVNQYRQVWAAIWSSKVGCGRASSYALAHRWLNPTNSNRLSIDSTHILIKGEFLSKLLGSGDHPGIDTLVENRKTDRYLSCERMKRWDELIGGVVAVARWDKFFMLDNHNFEVSVMKEQLCQTRSSANYPL